MKANNMQPKKIFSGFLIFFMLFNSACQKDDTPACSYPKNAKLKRIVHCYEPDLECPTIEYDGTIEKEFIYNREGKIEKVNIRPKYEEGVLTQMSEYELYDYD